MSVNPVAGNNGFQKIENSASHFSELNVSSSQVVDLNAQSVTTRVLNQSLEGLGTLYQVVGYAPSSFATAAAGSVLFLNNSQNSTDATSANDSRLLVLPENARVVSAVVTNNRTNVVGAADFDVGLEAWSDAPTGDNSVFDGVSLADVNSGSFVGSLLGAAAPLGLGSPGIALNVGAALGADSGVCVTVNTSPNTSGDLAVTVTYLL